MNPRNVYISPASKSDSMCDCDELEFEDFEVILTTLSKKSAVSEVEVPLQATVLQVAARKQRK